MQFVEIAISFGAKSKLRHCRQRPFLASFCLYKRFYCFTEKDGGWWKPDAPGQPKLRERRPLETGGAAAGESGAGVHVRPKKMLARGHLVLDTSDKTCAVRHEEEHDDKGINAGFIDNEDAKRCMIPGMVVGNACSL